MGKGSNRRPTLVPRKKYEDNWDATFGKKTGCGGTGMLIDSVEIPGDMPFACPGCDECPQYIGKEEKNDNKN